MEKIHFSITISAPKQKVWDTMLQDKTYREWTSVFCPTSYYEGDWSTGSDIRFLGPEENGSVSGMISRIKESRPHDFVSIQHLGEIREGVEKLWTEVETAAGEALENYTFTEVANGDTEVSVDLDIVPEYKEMMEEMWPKALLKLKEVVERVE